MRRVTSPAAAAWRVAVWVLPVLERPVTLPFVTTMSEAVKPVTVSLKVMSAVKTPVLDGAEVRTRVTEGGVASGAV